MFERRRTFIGKDVGQTPSISVLRARVESRILLLLTFLGSLFQSSHPLGCSTYVIFDLASGVNFPLFAVDCESLQVFVSPDF